MLPFKLINVSAGGEDTRLPKVAFSANCPYVHRKNWGVELNTKCVNFNTLLEQGGKYRNKLTGWEFVLL